MGRPTRRGMNQRTKNTWKAIVTTENALHAGPCRATSVRLDSGDLRTHPMSAAPRTFGAAKTIQPQNPMSRTSKTGRNIPMHQVHELPRKTAQRRAIARGLGFVGSGLKIGLTGGGPGGPFAGPWG